VTVFSSIIVARLLDIRLLKAYIQNEEKGSSAQRFTVALMDLLSMHRDIINIVRLCVSRYDVVRQQLLADKLAMKQAIQLLELTYSGLIS